MSQELKPEFGGFRELQKLFGIGKKRAYELERAGRITILRDRKRGAKMCRVSIDFESVRNHFAELRAEQSKRSETISAN